MAINGLNYREYHCVVSMCHFSNITSLLYKNRSCKHGEIFLESCKSKSILDCNFTFLNDLAPNVILFGAKSIREV